MALGRPSHAWQAAVGRRRWSTALFANIGSADGGGRACFLVGPSSSRKVQSLRIIGKGCATRKDLSPRTPDSDYRWAKVRDTDGQSVWQAAGVKRSICSNGTPNLIEQTGGAAAHRAASTGRGGGNQSWRSRGGPGRACRCGAGTGRSAAPRGWAAPMAVGAARKLRRLATIYNCTDGAGFGKRADAQERGRTASVIHLDW